MTRAELEHLIRAAGAIAEVDELIIVGSQAILGRYPDAPPELLRSRDADLYPPAHPERADLIDGAIGEGSPFEEEFGYYAHGVGPETAVLPPGWRDRLIPIRGESTRGVTGLCLHPTDIAVSKLVAGRERDIEFVRALLKHTLVSELDIRNAAAGLSTSHRKLALDRLARW